MSSFVIYHIGSNKKPKHSISLPLFGGTTEKQNQDGGGQVADIV